MPSKGGAAPALRVVRGRPERSPIVPIAGRGCNDAPSARKHVQHAALELAEIFPRVRAGEQLLRHNGTQELERSEQEVEPLELGVGSGLAKRPDEKVRVENVLPCRCRAHRAVLSGGVIRTPSMARVPLMSKPICVNTRRGRKRPSSNGGR